MFNQYTPDQIQAFASLATLLVTLILVGVTTWYTYLTRKLVKQARHERSIDSALVLHWAILEMEKEIGTLRLNAASREDIIRAMQNVHSKWAGYFSAHKMLLDDNDLHKRIHALTIRIAKAINGIDNASDSDVDKRCSELHKDLKEFPQTLEAHIGGRSLPADRFSDASKSLPP